VLFEELVWVEIFEGLDVKIHLASKAPIFERTSVSF
jgi:hypothetical protein